ncbi:MAG: relaxase/mobilization nuclease domain-containing protein [Oscillospiraceae bacterium]
MAIVKSIKNPIKSSSAVLGAVNYITNPKKAFAVAYENCIGNAAELSKQFYVTRQAFNQNKNILAHHYVQSFSPDDNITPEQAHQIGLELIKKIAPNYQVVLGTHIDKGHIHNHFIINSCNIETGYKWHNNKSSLSNIRNESDKLCKKNDLSVISEKGKFKSLDQTTYQLAKKGRSWKINLIKDLDEALISCKGKIDFIDFLNKKNYSVKYSDSSITVQKLGEKKAIRVDTLAKQFGSKYSKENIEKKLNIPISLIPKKEFVPKEKYSQKLYSSEWERFENWTFKSKSKSSQLLTAERLWKENQNSQKSIGNISFSRLKNVQGENYQIKIPPELLTRLVNKPIFYSAKVFDSTALVTIKAKDKNLLSKILNISLEEMNKQDVAIANQSIYTKLKADAENANEKLEYLIITPEQMEILKDNYIEFAAFTKDDKINIAFNKKKKTAYKNCFSPQEKKILKQNLQKIAA